ncbi:MAG: hypothetical protein GY822_10215 [Deltaproteobacteria bacterium]|nr:hypothetical protein [Deltaproteobacteria bacterium]
MPFDAPEKKALTRLPSKISGKSAEEKEPTFEAKQRFLCAFCNAPIARTDDVFSVAGSIKHTFMNPDGILFHVLCFSRAPGVLCHGEPTSHFSFFPGTFWSFADCGDCRMHLGWRYDDDEHAFFGFIQDRLVLTS